MDVEKSIRAIEERLRQLRERANEALAEIRHLEEQVRRLADGD